MLTFKIYSNILPLNIYEKLKSSVFNAIGSNVLEQESKMQYVNEKSFGYLNLKETLEVVPFFDELIKKDYGSNYTFSNSYTRIYFKNSLLSPHVDRPGLDLTASYLLYDNLDNKWPIHFSNTVFDNVDWERGQGEEVFVESFTPAVLNFNEMVVCEGRKVPHWRDKLNCKYYQYSVHIFFHWKKNSDT